MSDSYTPPEQSQEPVVNPADQYRVRRRISHNAWDDSGAGYTDKARRLARWHREQRQITKEQGPPITGQESSTRR